MSINWKPTSSPDYHLLMAIFMAICGIGLLSAVFPLFELVFTIFVIAVGVLTAVAIVARVIHQRRLDNDAFYGPIPQDEESETRTEKEVR